MRLSKGMDNVLTKILTIQFYRSVLYHLFSLWLADSYCSHGAR